MSKQQEQALAVYLADICERKIAAEHEAIMTEHYRQLHEERLSSHVAPIRK